ncbi:30S ribosomal protein S12 methylthiotransferase RimO, partial [Candidatus Calescamantes bacterium]|nr:30S ribosomal protein S12 methylthiotransferase RimO [Candidatus Calescamantes bacterium]
MKISCISLGCAKNRVDSEKMLGKLLEKGWEITSPDEARFTLVNTCAFLKEAREESEEVIRSLIQKGKKVIVAGCLPVYYGERIKEKFPGILGSLGPGDLDKITSIVEKDEAIFCWNTQKKEIILPRFISTSPFWEYLKIGEGCDNFCSYCLIPKLRGRYMSYRKEVILAEAKALVECGIKELVIVSQ